LRTHNSTVQRTELQQSKCFTENEYRCVQRSILRPTGELKQTYIKPYRARELTMVLWCAKHKRTNFITAELGRALSVVKVAFQVNENSQFSGVCPQKLLAR